MYNQGICFVQERKTLCFRENVFEMCSFEEMVINQVIIKCGIEEHFTVGWEQK
jgi:hypothetical protein